jgi:hypothetical protein
MYSDPVFAIRGMAMSYHFDFMQVIAPPAALLERLKADLAIAPLGPPVGNLSVARCTLGGAQGYAAIVEGRIASGSIGMAEAARLVPLFRLARQEKVPLVLYLESAGARVSEGLKALGAFRAMYREALSAALAGAPIYAVVGRNCFGGASMLAHLARVRVLHPSAQLAMSGPSILAQAAGASALDEMFRAMAEATLGAEARRKASARNLCWDGGTVFSAQALAAANATQGTRDWIAETLAALASRVPKRAAPAPAEPVLRKGLEKCFPEGYTLTDTAGVVTGEAKSGEEAIGLLGIIGGRPLGAERALGLASHAWKIALERRYRRAVVLLDCESHLANLDEERAVLSEYLAALSLSLAVLRATGTALETLVLGRSGGGVYVAMASPSDKVRVAHGTEIQVLPGAAIASILGDLRETPPEIDDYRAAGVADEELKLGLVPERALTGRA